MFTAPLDVSILGLVANKAHGPLEFEYHDALSMSSSASSTVTFNVGVMLIPVVPLLGLGLLIIGDAHSPTGK